MLEGPIQILSWVALSFLPDIYWVWYMNEFFFLSLEMTWKKFVLLGTLFAYPEDLRAASRIDAYLNDTLVVFLPQHVL